MKSILVLILFFVSVQCMYCLSSKEPLADQRCDSHGYYFDRGGRRMFETSYDSYKRGSFNLRRGHLWQDQSCKKQRRTHKCKRLRCTEVNSDQEENIKHEHYAAQEGLTSWPSAPGPDRQGGTSAFPYVATPVWLRDTPGPSNGYATPTSWQGFQ